MVSIKRITATKRDQIAPVAQLVKGDRLTSGININISRYEAGVDLSKLGWCINIKNASGDTDIQMFTPDVTDMWISYDWVFPAIVAASIGECEFSVEAVTTDGNKVWKSGKRYISVIDGVSATAGYDEDELSLFLQTVAAVGTKITAMGTKIDGYEARIIASEAAANTAATNASNAVANANTAVNSANIAASNAQQAAEAAQSVANSISQQAASGAFDGADGYTPVKGVDYFDGQDGYTPIKGVDYNDGEDGSDGNDWIPSDDELEGIANNAANKLQPTITQLSNSCDSATTSIQTLTGQVAGKQDSLADLDTIRSGAALGATALQTHQDISGKQDVITDLETIRSGASAGSTALQPKNFELIETITLTEDTKKIERSNLGLKLIVIFASNIVVKNGSTQSSGTFGISSLNNNAVKNIAFGGNSQSSAAVKNVLDLRVEGGLLFGTTFDTIADDYRTSAAKTPNALAVPKLVTSIDHVALSQWNGWNFASGCVFTIYGVRA